MNNDIKLACFVLIGVAVDSLGASFSDWEFWAIILAATAISMRPKIKQ
jgi:hypothetical protein